MKIKSAVIAAAGAAMLLGASGCSPTDLSRYDILRPPKTMGDEAEIEALISKTAPKGYTLKYPKNGSYRSAIIMRDLDGDDVKEAIAFFRDKDSPAGVHMLVMYENEGSWAVSDDFITETTDVDCVDFADVTGNSSQEIIAGYATYASNVNFLSVYTYKNGKTDAVSAGQNYSSFYCGSLDGSGRSKIITLSLFTPENEAKATLIEFDDKENKMISKASAPLDSNVVSYRGMSLTDLGDNRRGLVVDGVLSGGDMNTQVIYFNKELNLLRNPLYKEKLPNPTQRASSVLSTDLGSDGKIDIPVVTALPSVEDLTSADQIIWNTFSAEKEELIPVQRTAVNYPYNYIIKIPEMWKANTFTALINESGDLLSFYELDGTEAGEKLFDVRVFRLADWDQGKNTDGYTLIYKDTRSAYAFINNSADTAHVISDDEIKTAFAQLNAPTTASQNAK